MSIRTDLADKLRELFPTTKIIDTERSVDALADITLFLSLKSFMPAPQAAGVDATFEISIAWPGNDWDRAEGDLEDDVLELLATLTQNLPNLRWTTATKGTYMKYPAWRLDITVRTTITTEPDVDDDEPDTPEE